MATYASIATNLGARMAWFKDRSERRDAERRARADADAHAAAAKAAGEREQQQAAIAAQALELRDLIDTARTFRGYLQNEAPERSPVQLRKGERIYAILSDVLLVEPRSTGGQWKSGSKGISVRVPGTRSMRYSVGSTSGRYVPGQMVATSIDDGNVLVTDQRVVFVGPKYTREWAWSKCLAVDHQDDQLYTTIAVSNRQKASGIGYGPSSASAIRFRLDLAYAVATDSADLLVDDLEADLDVLEATLGIPTDPLAPGSALPPPPPPSA